MDVFITGASGYVGSHMARLLVRRGCTVHALLRHETNPWRIQDILPALEIVRGDLSNSESLREELRKIRPQIAFHFAWYAVPGDYLTSAQNIPHLKAGLDLGAMLIETGCQKFLAAGTCFEYDTSLGYLSESSPVNPRTLYSACKLSLFQTLTELCKPSNMSFTWLRFFHPYGPHENEGRLVRSVIVSLLRNELVKVSPGEQVRDLIHVEDAASAIWELSQSKVIGPVNIGTGIPVTFREVCSMVGRILGKLELIEFGGRSYPPEEPMFVCANNAKLKEGTGWRPHYELEQGLTQTIESWKENLASAAMGRA